MRENKRREELLQRFEKESHFFKTKMPMFVLPLVTTLICFLPLSLLALDYFSDFKIQSTIDVKIMSALAAVWLVYVWIFFIRKTREGKRNDAEARKGIKEIIRTSAQLSDQELEDKIYAYLESFFEGKAEKK